MLTKLLRYEFKSTGRVVLPIAAGELLHTNLANKISPNVNNHTLIIPIAAY